MVREGRALSTRSGAGHLPSAEIAVTAKIARTAWREPLCDLCAFCELTRLADRPAVGRGCYTLRGQE